MDEKILEKLNYLKLKGVAENWDQIIALAHQQQLSYERFLSELIEKEYALKKEASRLSRIKRAGMPEELLIETYPFELQPKLNKKKVMQIYDSLDYMKQNLNVVLVGPTGCGKSGIGTSLLIHALNQGYSGRFITFPDLVEDLYKSVADHTQKNTIHRYASYDCLLIDEIGYLELDPAQVGLFFTLMSKRHKKHSTIMTSNLGFKDWESVLKNKQLTAALIDRLTAQCHVINMRDCRTLRHPEQEK